MSEISYKRQSCFNTVPISPQRVLAYKHSFYFCIPPAACEEQFIYTVLVPSNQSFKEEGKK